MKETNFIDTNVILYRYSSDSEKSFLATRILNEIVDTGGVISTQILNEVTVAGRKKMGLSWEEVRELTEGLKTVFRVNPLTADTHGRAIAIAQRYQFSFWDSLVVASALEAGCDRLHTEDLSHNQTIEDRLVILNPFRSS